MMEAKQIDKETLLKVISKLTDIKYQAGMYDLNGDKARFYRYNRAGNKLYFFISKQINLL